MPSRRSGPAGGLAPRRPPDLKGTGLLLAPGAGADRNQPALVALDQAASALGARVVRMDFPYKKAGRKAPDRPAVLIEAVNDEAASLRAEVDRMILGGRSMGGRMCSMAVAQGLQADGLALVSYPLHAPGRRDRMRVEHFPALALPCIFVSGTRDAFGTPEELEAATRTIPGKVVHVWLEGKDHAMRGADAAVAEAILAWLAPAEKAT